MVPREVFSLISVAGHANLTRHLAHASLCAAGGVPEPRTGGAAAVGSRPGKESAYHFRSCLSICFDAARPLSPGGTTRKTVCGPGSGDGRFGRSAGKVLLLALETVRAPLLIALDLLVLASLRQRLAAGAMPQWLASGSEVVLFSRPRWRATPEVPRGARDASHSGQERRPGSPMAFTSTTGKDARVQKRPAADPGCLDRPPSAFDFPPKTLKRKLLYVWWQSAHRAGGNLFCRQCREP